jgi:hypothetical protein
MAAATTDQEKQQKFTKVKTTHQSKQHNTK